MYYVGWFMIVMAITFAKEFPFFITLVIGGVALIITQEIINNKGKW